MENETSTEKNITNSPTSEKLEGIAADVQKDDNVTEEMKSLDISKGDSKVDKDNGGYDTHERIDKSSVFESKFEGEMLGDNIEYVDMGKVDESMNLESKSPRGKVDDDNQQIDSGARVEEDGHLDSKAEKERKQTTEEILGEEEPEPVFDGTEVPGMEPNRSMSSRSLDADPEAEGSAWPEKAVAIKNFVKEKGAVAVTSVLRVLSGKRDEIGHIPANEDKVVSDSAKDKDAAEVSQKPVERSAWNPLSYVIIPHDVDSENKAKKGEGIAEPPEPLVMKGRIILYTRLGCQDCKEVRLFLHRKRLRYVEINIDLFPSRKLELDKFTGSSTVPKVFFNEVVIGGLSELKGLDESGKLEEKIDYLVSEAPAFEAPLPPLSGEDDVSSSGSIDELALIVRKMKESIVIKDRFCKMRRFTNCFLGTEAVDFLSEDQYLEREEVRRICFLFFFETYRVPEHKCLLY